MPLSLLRKKPPAAEPVCCCRYCGNEPHDVRIMITHAGLCICDVCVEMCADVVRRQIRNEDWEKLRHFAP